MRSPKRRCSPSLLVWRLLCGLSITSLLVTVAGLIPLGWVAVAAVPLWVVAGLLLLGGGSGSSASRTVSTRQ